MLLTNIYERDTVGTSLTSGNLHLDKVGSTGQPGKGIGPELRLVIRDEELQPGRQGVAEHDDHVAGQVGPQR